MIIALLVAVGVFFLIQKGKISQVNKELSYLYKTEVTELENDIYSVQEEMGITIDKEKNNKKNTLDNPYVIKNPYGISPLSALIIFTTKNEESVAMTINGNTYSFEKSKVHAIPVYGLVAGKENDVVIKCGNDSKTVKIDVSDVEKVDFDITAGKGFDIGDNFYIVGTPTEDGLYGFNTNGELIWRLTENFGQAIAKLDNGHLLLSNNKYILNASRTGLIEIDFMGKIYNVFDIEGGYHDDVFLLENNHVLLASSGLNRGTYYDLVVELDLNNGNIVKEWDLKTIINSVSNKFVESLNTKNWAGNNSVYYDKKTNSLILSLEKRNSVISIGYDTQKINWIFGDSKYWNRDFNDYLLKYDGVYPMLVNTARINSDGNLVLFNNNMDGLPDEDQACINYVNHKSSGQIYKIENKNISLVSEFKDNFYSYAVSNYNELENGNYLLFSAWQFKDGTMSRPECTMNRNVEDLTSTLYELDKNNNILFKATFLAGSYRADKMNFYNKNNKNYDYEALGYFNTQGKAMYEEVDTDTLVDRIKGAEDMEFAVVVSKKLLKINAYFQLNDKVELYLVGKDGITYKYLAKDANRYLQPTINLRDVKGECALLLAINDKFYNLNKVFNF